MLPGRSYKPEDILLLLWKHRWLIVIPLLLGTFGGLLTSRFLPNLYESDTLIQVVPQRVPESYVQSTVTTRIEDRLQSISQQIMSRTRLERIIDEFDLFRDERETTIMEDIVQRMRNQHISIDMVGGNNPQDAVGAFRVRFRYTDALTSMQVTERLASLFIDENLRDRGSLADATNDFLNTQLVEARTNLEAQDQRLEVFRQRYAGRLPSQAPTNLQAIQNRQLQLQALTESLARDRDRKLMLERLFNDANVDLANASPSVAGGFLPGGEGEEPVPQSAQGQLELARTVLAQMQLRLTPQHPDIVRMNRTIAELEQKAAEEALQQPLSPFGEAPPPATPREAERRAQLREMRAELESVDRQIAFKESEQENLRGELAEYQQRLETVPELETEWIALTRDYETLKRTYEDLLAKSEASKVAANLERRQIGEQFRVLDPARLPERPMSPNRSRINSMAAGLGLVLGLAFIGLLEYRDSSFRTEADVRTALVLPVVALVPRVVTRVERRRERRKKLLLATLGFLLFGLVGGGLTYWFELWNYLV